MFAVLVAVRVQIVMSAVLMLSIMLIVIGITCQRLHGFLLHDKATGIIGVSIPAYHPAAVVTDIVKLRDLVRLVVGIVGADAIRAVDLGDTVDGVVHIGGHQALPVRHFDQVIVQVILVAYLCPVRIGDGGKVVRAVIGVSHRIALGFFMGKTALFFSRRTTGGHRSNPAQAVIGILCVSRTVIQGHPLPQGVISVGYGSAASLSLGISISLFHQGVQLVIVIGDGVAAIGSIGSQPPRYVVSHALRPALGVRHAGQVAHEVVGIPGSPSQVIGDGGQVPHHIIGIVGRAALGIRHAGESVHQIVDVGGGEAAGVCAGKHISVGVISIALRQSPFIRIGDQPVGLIVNITGGLAQRVYGADQPVILVIGVSICVSHGVGDGTSIVVFVIAVAGGALSRCGDPFNVAHHVVYYGGGFLLRIGDRDHPVYFIVGISESISQGVGHGGEVVPHIIAVGGNAALGIGDREQVVQHVIGILRGSAQIVLLPDDIVPGIVGKGGLVSQRGGDPCQPVGRVIGIAVDTPAGQGFPFHLAICVHLVLRHAAQGIRDLCHHVMAVIGIVLLGSQGRDLFHHSVQGVIFILPGLPHAVCHGEDISHGVVAVPLRDSLRGSDGGQVVPAVIGVLCLSAVSVGVGHKAAQSVVAVRCPYSVSVCPRRQVAISIIGKCGGGSLRIHFLGKAVQGVISIGIKRLSGQSLSGQISCCVIGISCLVARRVGDRNKPIQYIIGVKSPGPVHIRNGNHPSESVIFI